MDFLAHLIGKIADGRQFTGFEQTDTVFKIEALTVLDFLENIP